MVVQVRRATADDVALLHELAAATFALACPPHTTAAQSDEFVRTELSAARFGDYLADPARVLMIAEVDGEPAGYTMLIAGEPSDPDAAAAVATRPTVELSKCYVLERFHGAGVGAPLMAASLDAASATGAVSVWLGVNIQNDRANRFYEKCGFAIVGSKRFRMGESWEDDFVRMRAPD